MQLSKGDLLHVYNRGNNKQKIFFDEDNYQFFLNKVKKEIGSVSDILAYCLMPNHFHFLVHVNDTSCKPKKLGSLLSTELQNGFRVLQSSYANAINKQFNRTGSIFQQKTKFKLLNDMNNENTSLSNYAEVCFNYIHQNPLKAGLVTKLEDWNHSSFKEYRSKRLEGMCNKSVAIQLLNIDVNHFYENSYAAIKAELLENIWLL